MRSACPSRSSENERGFIPLRASHESGQAHFYVSDVPDSFVQTADLFLAAAPLRMPGD
jgi:hypothetical protein